MFFLLCRGSRSRDRGARAVRGFREERARKRAELLLVEVDFQKLFTSSLFLFPLGRRGRRKRKKRWLLPRPLGLRGPRPPPTATATKAAASWTLWPRPCLSRRRRARNESPSRNAVAEAASLSAMASRRWRRTKLDGRILLLFLLTPCSALTSRRAQTKG